MSGLGLELSQLGTDWILPPWSVLPLLSPATQTPISIRVRCDLLLLEHPLLGFASARVGGFLSCRFSLGMDC
uniref:Uncharacterized protein n=1 Tax=Kalanchoe fedtschenkoi TaxID=63787 RepID=A0A7N0TRL0_KALFE